MKKSQLFLKVAPLAFSNRTYSAERPGERWLGLASEPGPKVGALCCVCLCLGHCRALLATLNTGEPHFLGSGAVRRWEASNCYSGSFLCVCGKLRFSSKKGHGSHPKELFSQQLVEKGTWFIGVGGSEPFNCCCSQAKSNPR